MRQMCELHNCSAALVESGCAAQLPESQRWRCLFGQYAASVGTVACSPCVAGGNHIALAVPICIAGACHASLPCGKWRGLLPLVCRHSRFPPSTSAPPWTRGSWSTSGGGSRAVDGMVSLAARAAALQQTLMRRIECCALSSLTCAPRALLRDAAMVRSSHRATSMSQAFLPRPTRGIASVASLCETHSSIGGAATHKVQPCITSTYRANSSATLRSTTTSSTASRSWTRNCLTMDATRAASSIVRLDVCAKSAHARREKHDGAHSLSGLCAYYSDLPAAPAYRVTDESPLIRNY